MGLRNIFPNYYFSKKQTYDSNHIKLKIRLISSFIAINAEFMLLLLNNIIEYARATLLLLISVYSLNFYQMS